MLILFCCGPFHPTKVDESFASEAEAATALGHDTALIDFESLLEGNAAKAFRKTQIFDQPRLAIYRGWMLSVEKYATLYDSLLGRGIRLVNNPGQYRHCHCLPESYLVIAPCTARTVWIDKAGGFGFDRVMQAIEPFGSRAIIVKDYVKSQKHYWSEACFIADASDRAGVERVVGKFIELQDEDLAGGLVFREYVPLRKLADHSKGGMPLAIEYRVFVLDGEPLLVCDCWDEGQYAGEPPDIGLFREVISRVHSRFFTMTWLNGQMELG